MTRTTITLQGDGPLHAETHVLHGSTDGKPFGILEFSRPEDARVKVFIDSPDDLKAIGQACTELARKLHMEMQIERAAVALREQHAAEPVTA